MLAQLWALWEKTPPPPTIPALPQARGAIVPTVGYSPLYRTPSRPAKPPPLAELQAKAARLRRLRRPRLDRPRLHAGHDHPNLGAILESAAAYVAGNTSPLPLPAPSPWELRALGQTLDNLDASIDEHQWGHALRIDDVRRSLDLPTPARTW